MNRVKTGIPGLDEIIGGGFPEKRSVLLSGACGTGKSIFAMQYIFEGAKKYSEPGIFVTLDERPNILREDMRQFGWDLEKLEEQNMVHVIDASLAKIGISSEEEFSMPASGFDLNKLLLEILRLVKRNEAKRVAIDSLSSLGINFKNEQDAKNAVLKISYLLMRIGVTGILTSEIEQGSNKFGRYGVEEFVVDGVIVLSYMGLGTQSNRTLHVRKMRSTNHSEDIHPIKIGSNGFSVKRIDKTYENT